MRAYCVLSGGGLHGVALCGALTAARGKGIVFRGYGGTSMGAIVAFLAALGLSGNDIKDLLIQTFEEEGVLRKGLQEYDRFTNGIRRILNMPEAKRPTWWKNLGINIWHFLRLPRLVLFLVWHSISLAKHLKARGLIDMDALRGALELKAHAQIGDLLGPNERIATLTFARLKEIRKCDLKIVATDVSGRRAVVFPDHDDKLPVIDAVLASAAYPGVFIPRRHNAQLLVDGGVASNTPAFIFKEEAKRSYSRTIVFSLEQEGAAATLMSFLDQLGAITRTALSASDHLIRNLLRRLVVIPLTIPADLPVLSGDPKVLRRLHKVYANAIEEADKRLKEDTILRQLGDNDIGIRDRLAAEYPPEDEISVVLSALRFRMASLAWHEEMNSDQELLKLYGAGRLDAMALTDRVRACMFVPDITSNGWYIAFDSGFEPEYDYHGDLGDPVLPSTDPDGVGLAIRERRVVAFNPQSIRSRAREHRPPEAGKDAPKDRPGTRIPPCRRGGIAIPVFHSRTAWPAYEKRREATDDVLAVLCVDAPFPLDQLHRSLQERNGQSPEARLHLQLVEYSKVISRLLGG